MTRGAFRSSLWTACAAGALAAFSCSSALAQTSPTSSTIYHRFDVMGREVGTILPDPDGAGTLPFPATRSTYDADGRVIMIETGALSTWMAGTIAPQDWTGFSVYSTKILTYDLADRKTSEAIKGDDGVVAALTQYNYTPGGGLQCTAVRMNPATFGSPPSDACILGSQGSQGPDRITRNAYDASGQLLKVQKAYATSLQQDYVTYTYTANGKQATVVDANGNKAAFGYDGFDRLTTWQFPDQTTAGTVSSTDYEQYGYDANGNRTSLRKRDGRTVAYTYDSLNRVTAKTAPPSCVLGYACTNVPASLRRDVYYSYDLRGLQTSARFDSASGSDAVISGYDGFGRQTATTTSMGGVSRTLLFQYDADGDRTRVTHPDGNYFAFEYDGLDRAKTIKENGSAAIATITFDWQARLSGDTRGAVSTAYGYDAASRLASIADDLPGTASDVTSSFAYNPASQITSRVRSNDYYAFGAYFPTSRSYVANGLNQYASVAGVSYGYDSNGNLTASGSTAYTYDAENRLVVASTGANLVYDPLGRLYETNVGGGSVTRFLYDGDQLTAEYSSTGTLLRRYVHGTGEDDPLLWYEAAGLSDRRSLQIDQQGSVVSVANTAGAATIYSYDEYGVPTTYYAGRFQYTGQAWIPELGMYYYKARIYSPMLGRFMQTDPIGYKDQINLYAYVANDPVNGRDPTGLAKTCSELRKSGYSGATCTELYVVDKKTGVRTNVGLRLSELPTKAVADKHFTSKDGLYIEVPISAVLQSSEVDWAKLDKDHKYVLQLGNNPGALDKSNRRAQVLGSVTVTLARNGSGKAGIFNDTYDFEMHKLTSVTEFFRNVGTYFYSPGAGKNFDFHFSGYIDRPPARPK